MQIQCENLIFEKLHLKSYKPIKNEIVKCIWIKMFCLVLGLNDHLEWEIGPNEFWREKE